MAKKICHHLLDLWNFCHWISSLAPSHEVGLHPSGIRYGEIRSFRSSQRREIIFRGVILLNGHRGDGVEEEDCDGAHSAPSPSLPLPLSSSTIKRAIIHSAIERERESGANVVGARRRSDRQHRLAFADGRDVRSLASGRRTDRRAPMAEDDDDDVEGRGRRGARKATIGFRSSSRSLG